MREHADDRGVGRTYDGPEVLSGRKRSSPTTASSVSTFQKGDRTKGLDIGCRLGRGPLDPAPEGSEKKGNLRCRHPQCVCRRALHRRQDPRMRILRGGRGCRSSTAFSIGVHEEAPYRRQRARGMEERNHAAGKRIDCPSTGPAQKKHPDQVHEDACHHDTTHPRTTQADLQSEENDFRTPHRGIARLPRPWPTASARSPSASATRRRS